MGFLTGKRALVVGVASDRSIATGIAEAMHREGAELAFTYQNERFKDRLAKFAEEFGSQLIFPCDVADDDQINALFAALGADGRYGTLERADDGLRAVGIEAERAGRHGPAGSTVHRGPGREPVVTYRMVAEDWKNFATKRIAKPSDIFPVFHEADYFNVDPFIKPSNQRVLVSTMYVTWQLSNISPRMGNKIINITA